MWGGGKEAGTNTARMRRGVAAVVAPYPSLAHLYWIAVLVTGQGIHNGCMGVLGHSWPIQEQWRGVGRSRYAAKLGATPAANRTEQGTRLSTVQ